MVKSRRISDCKAPATVIDSQTTNPPLGEILQLRVKPHPAWTRARELFTALVIWASAKSYGIHALTRSTVQTLSLKSQGDGT